MPNPILLPSLSPTMKSGNLIKWFVKTGDKVKAGDEIAEIETDKAIMVQEAEQDGVIVAILVKQGEENIPVNTPIGIIADEDEQIEQKDIENIIANIHKKPTDQTQEQDNNKNYNSDKQQKNENLPEIPKQTPDIPKQQKKIFATPLARNIAKNNDIMLENINGSGPNGRIVKIDVENAIELEKKHEKQTFEHKQQKTDETDSRYVKKTLSNIRKIIARRLTLAKKEIPHFYLDIECNVEKIIEARKNILEKYDAKISINDFIIKAAARALILTPEVNSSFENDELFQHKNADISVAVATDDGVMTPIIFDAQKKGLNEIANEVKILAQKAKNKKLLPHQYEGGSFSISNLGMFGIKKFYAVINPPQAAIIAVGSIENKIDLKTENYQNEFYKNINVAKIIQITKIINVTMSCDHRVIDGAQAAQFLQKLKIFIEDPVQILA